MFAELETLSATSADRGAAVQTSEVEDPGDKVCDLRVNILRSRSNSFGCRRVSGLQSSHHEQHIQKFVDHAFEGRTSLDEVALSAVASASSKSSRGAQM
jgi:hypothetical protein